MKEIIKPRNSQTSPTKEELRNESKKFRTIDKFLVSVGLDPNEYEPAKPIEP